VKYGRTKSLRSVRFNLACQLREALTSQLPEQIFKNPFINFFARVYKAVCMQNFSSLALKLRAFRTLPSYSLCA